MWLCVYVCGCVCVLRGCVCVLRGCVCRHSLCMPSSEPSCSTCALCEVYDSWTARREPSERLIVDSFRTGIMGGEGQQDAFQFLLRLLGPMIDLVRVWCCGAV